MPRLLVALLIASLCVTTAVPRAGAGGPSPYWVKADYLHWWTQGGRTPPLVTTSPDNTPRSAAGVLGQPGTAILLGNERLGGDGRSGWRITLGYRLDCCGCGGLEASYFNLADEEVTWSGASNGIPILAVPFFDALTGIPAANPVAFPGQLSGRLDIEIDSEVQGAELLITEDIHASPGRRLELLSGYRYFGLDETLGIVERSVVLNDPLGMVPTDTIFEIVDRFDVDNEFHGAQVGLRGMIDMDCFSLIVLGKIAMGVNHQVVAIDGRQRVDVPGASRVDSPHGTLTQASNIGRYSQHKFAVVPEVSVDLACKLTDHVRVSAGYTFLYFTRIVRPGDQVDLLVDTTQTVARPDFSFEGGGLWVQGFHASLIVNY